MKDTTPTTDTNDRARDALDALIKTAPKTPGRKPADSKSRAQKAKALAAARVVTLPTSGGIFGDVPDPAVCEQTATLPMTRMGLAQRIHAHYGEIIAYRPATHAWVVYQDGVWAEGDLIVSGITRRVIRSISVHEAGWAERKSEDVQRIQARIDALTAAGQQPSDSERTQLRSARTAARHAIEKYAENAENGAHADRVLGDLASICAVDEDAWDAHPFLINFTNGTINIGKDHRDPETGYPVLYPHDPTQHITMKCAIDYDPDAWSDDLDKVKDHLEQTGPGTWDAITRYLAYGLTGDMLAKTYLNIWSPPDAAKSTLLDAFFEAIGGKADTSYAGMADPADFSAGRAESGKAQPGIDALRGKRLIFIHEAQHLHLGSDLVKRWTGGDAIRTRTLKAKGGVWQPVGKLLLVGNGPTPFTASDSGMIGRFFGVALTSLTKDKIDTGLRHRLRSETGQRAVLAAIIKAACDWYDDNKGGMGARGALRIPAHAEKHKAEALVTINPLTDWLDADCHVGSETDLNADHGDTGRCTTAHLTAAYNIWAKRHGQPPYTPRKFGPLLTAAGVDGSVDTEFKIDRGYCAPIRVKGLIRTGIRLANEARWKAIIDA